MSKGASVTRFVITMPSEETSNGTTDAVVVYKNECGVDSAGTNTEGLHTSFKKAGV